MTTYTAIANSAIDQDSPVTQPLMTALRDNPIAITEGASGAPRVQPEALALYYVSGSATRSTSGSSAVVEVTDLDNVDYVLLTGSILVTSASALGSVVCAVSTDNGATYGSEVTAFSVQGTSQNYESSGFGWIADVSGGNAIEVRCKNSVNSASVTVVAQVSGFGV